MRNLKGRPYPTKYLLINNDGHQITEFSFNFYISYQTKKRLAIFYAWQDSHPGEDQYNCRSLAANLIVSSSRVYF